MAVNPRLGECSVDRALKPQGKRSGKNLGESYRLLLSPSLTLSSSPASGMDVKVSARRLVSSMDWNSAGK